MLLVARDVDGGTSSSDYLAVDMFVPHLLSGFACMNFLSNISSDIALVRGRYGCRPGAFFMYFGCRYLSLLSMIMLLVWFDVYSAAPIDTICKAAAALSLAFAYGIIVVRICAWFPQTYFCLALEISALAFWGLTVAGMQDIGHPWANHSNIFLSEITFMFSLSTGALVGALFHVLYVRRGDHRFRIRQCGKLLWKENVPELALIWGVVFPETVLYYLDRSADFLHHFTVAYGAFVVFTILVCRLYRTMVERLDYCPFDKYSPVYGSVKAVAVFIASKLSINNHDERLQGQAHSKSILHILFLKRPSDERVRHTASGRTVSFTTTPRQGGRRRSESTCPRAVSRTTYAQSSLYDSRELESNVAAIAPAT